MQDPKLTQLPLVERDSKPIPQVTKKKKKMTKHTKVAGAGLEGFVDWMELTVSESIEEGEAEMFSTVVGFATRMCK